MKRLKPVFSVMVLLVTSVFLEFPALGQQQPIDTRQRPTNPPQSAVGVPQLPSQRALPLDRWGRAVVPGRRDVAIPGKDQTLEPGFQQYGLLNRNLRNLYQGRYGLYRDTSGRIFFGRIP